MYSQWKVKQDLSQTRGNKAGRDLPGIMCVRPKKIFSLIQETAARTFAHRHTKHIKLKCQVDFTSFIIIHSSISSCFTKINISVFTFHVLKQGMSVN